LKNNTETFSTIDITLIDCYTGIARFIKAGASTSFLLRNGEVTVIRSNSFPIGILREIDIHSHQLQLKQGDLLVMVTDGMLATKEDVLGKEETFKHFITQVMEADPEYIAHTLMEKSKNLLVNEEKDDMTIMVAKIWQKY
jgi:stage II sporulation protein E